MTTAPARAAGAWETTITEAEAAAAIEMTITTTAAGLWEDHHRMETVEGLLDHLTTADVLEEYLLVNHTEVAARTVEEGTEIQDHHHGAEETTATDRDLQRGIIEAMDHRHRHDQEDAMEEAAPAEETTAAASGHLQAAEGEAADPPCQLQNGVATDHPEFQDHPSSADPTLAEGCPWYNPSAMVEESLEGLLAEEDLSGEAPEGEEAEGIGLMRIRIPLAEGQSDIEKILKTTIPCLRTSFFDLICCNVRSKSYFPYLFKKNINAMLGLFPLFFPEEK